MNIGSGQFVYMAMMQDSPYQVKIGHSRNPIDRERSLFSAGVPEPYHMLHVWKVHDMLHVEEGVIHPWLVQYRNIYGKEIFHLDCMYPDLIDPDVLDNVNGLNLANKLAEDIDVYLKQRNIAYQRVWYDELELYDNAIRWQKKSS
ncbi:GIY-YIG nuclease family protein [Chromobacterium violaceum]|uniref:GIY-YIG nuclease family protein n=1 Tax=Chromobacterium violaceum TaxID=536 RepID=UPI0015F8D292|nr:GIY-YIG nuclease family protein [Chromobacterium violaceum]MBA8733993.1 GIY-YIG nuclease family protein [Chromobacterium violaceum]